MKPIVVTASTSMELSLLVSAFSAVSLRGVGHLEAYRGACGQGELIIAVTGMGKVNAASAATVLLERFTASLLINIGCGGAFPDSGLGVGALAVATSETCADEGVETPQGWRGLDLIGIPVYQGRGEQIFNQIKLSRDLATKAHDLARKLGFATGLGPFLTVSTCSGTSQRANELQRRFPGICENMEGAALAQVALIYGVPFLEVRGISNLVEDRDLSKWNLGLAVSQVQEFLLRYLGN